MSEASDSGVGGIAPPLGCYDCGLAYGGPGWCDCYIPTEVWVQISPSGNEGSVLCITCIARRLVEVGIDTVPLRVTSGPWDFDQDRAIAALMEETRAWGLRVGRAESVEQNP